MPNTSQNKIIILLANKFSKLLSAVVECCYEKNQNARLKGGLTDFPTRKCLSKLYHRTWFWRGLDHKNVDIECIFRWGIHFGSLCVCVYPNVCQSSSIIIICKWKLFTIQRLGPMDVIICALAICEGFMRDLNYNSPNCLSYDVHVGASNNTIQISQTWQLLNQCSF